uniref:Uncharacterized protein n=1 Tax=Podarcis muralis TaxID=64176 RepID=A0A670ICQ5_PODMU
MVHWTAEEKQLINTLWSKVDVAALGGDTLSCRLTVFPWTRRLFSNLDDPLQPSLSLGTSPALSARGQGAGLYSLALGTSREPPPSMDLDKVKETFSELRELLCNKLHMDPVSFRVRLLPRPKGLPGGGLGGWRGLCVCVTLGGLQT